MESYSVQPFETSFSRLAQCCWGVSKQVCITVVHSRVAVNFQSYDFQTCIEYVMIVVYVAHTMFLYMF